jgi:plasmid stability protein
MTNLTLTIDDELLKRARIRALEQDTSVNALVREYLEGLAGQAKMQDAVAAVLDLAKLSEAGSGPKGRTWTRDELHER